MGVTLLFSQFVCEAPGLVATLSVRSAYGVHWLRKHHGSLHHTARSRAVSNLHHHSADPYEPTNQGGGDKSFIVEMTRVARET